MKGPPAARIVVLGGGIAGCSAAWHLATLGARDVLLLERSSLSSGTTWHSTGNMETYRADPLAFDMVRYAVDLYPRVAAEADRDIGWRQVGRVMYTDSEERWDAMRALPELGRARGIELEALDGAGLRKRLPILSTGELIGGLWVPGDARVNPTDAVLALASAARARGVMLRTDTLVEEILLSNGCVRGVRTAAGVIDCETVVLAAGLWSGELARSAGLSLPLYALEHQYLITQPLGIDRDLPLFLSYDDQLYGREEVGGLMIGSLDDHAIALSTAQLPQTFSFSLLNERWPQFEPYLATAMRRFPLLQDAPVKMLLNGPESFTPDGHMLLGPVPGASGLFAVCGFNSNGMALAPAAGRYIAEWIVEGEPSAETERLDVRRFSAVQSAEAYLRERVTEIPGYACRIHSADDDYATARDIRHSPLHAQFLAAGARFASVNGWERPTWIRQPDAANFLAAVAQETAAAQTGTLLIERSADAKYLLGGDGADRWLTGLLPGNRARTAAWLTPLPGRHGQIEALVRILPWGSGNFLVTAGPEQEMRVAEWLRTHAPAGVITAGISAAYALLELHGPRRAELLSAAGGPQWAGSAPVRTFDDLENESTLVAASGEYSAHLFSQLMASAARVGVRLGGHLAQEAIRIQRGVPGFGREATPSRLAPELATRWKALRPEAAADSPIRARQRRVLTAFASPVTLRGFGDREVVLHGDRAVGEITSLVRLPGWDNALALAMLDPRHVGAGTLEFVMAGRRWPLKPRPTAWGKIL